MLQKVLIIINLVVVLVATGVVVYSHTLLKPEPTNQTAEEESLKKDATQSSQIQPVPIKKFVVNLHSKSSRLRYLDIEMNVLTFREDQKQLIKENEHIIKDIVIDLASQYSPEDLDSLTGKLLLEKKIKDRVNARLGELPVVKQIYFSTYVIQ